MRGGARGGTAGSGWLQPPEGRVAAGGGAEGRAGAAVLPRRAEPRPDPERPPAAGAPRPADSNMEPAAGPRSVRGSDVVAAAAWREPSPRGEAQSCVGSCGP